MQRPNQSAPQAQVYEVPPAPFTGLDGMKILKGTLLIFGGKEASLVNLTGKLGEATFEIKEVGRRNRFGPTARLEVFSTVKTLKAQGLSFTEPIPYVSQNGEAYTSQTLVRIV
jgi:hypothetical protein